jgi:hypothetical protein
MEGIKRRREFEEALRNIISKLDREGKDRLDRSEVEEIGEQYDLDPEKARELFLASKGDVWEGELIDGEGEPGWEAARLDRAPASGDNLSV